MTKPIVAAGQATDKGQGVWLSGNGGYILDMRSAKKIERLLGDKSSFIELKKKKAAGRGMSRNSEKDDEVEEDRPIRVKSAPALIRERPRPTRGHLCDIPQLVRGVCGRACNGSQAIDERIVCLKNPLSTQHVRLCTFETSPCVPASRAHMFQHVRAVPAYTGTFWMYTRGRVGRTHGRRREGEGPRQHRVFISKNDCFLTFLEHLNRLLGSSLIANFLLTMNGPSRVIMCFRGSPKETVGFKFENRSRTTCSRFLQTFAVPDKVVQLQLSCSRTLTGQISVKTSGPL